MAPISPQPQNNGIPAISPRTSSATQRPAMMKRTSSQNQVAYSSRMIGRSPGYDFEAQPSRRGARGKGHARIVLPRNHSSAHNLARLARQIEFENRPGKNHSRQRSHEGDTEIRLPGSLDESEVRPPPIRRNLTAYNLPRNASHAKLKKNLSHGHLQRLAHTKDLVPLTTTSTTTTTTTTTTKHKHPLSPGVKGRSARPKSVDWIMEKDLHQQEVELAIQQQERREALRRPERVAGDDNADADQVANMEGSGLDEGEWTEESTSVSPYSTRQNTANNSRRASVHHHHDPSSDRSTLAPTQPHPPLHRQSLKQHEESDNADTETEADGTPADSLGKENRQVYQRLPTATEPAPVVASTVPKSPLHAAKEHPNPTAQLLRRNSNQLPAPALVSNVTAVDDARSLRNSPAASLQSSNIAGEQEELISRFIPSTSNGSGTTTNNTTQNTPKSGSFHTPDDDFRPQRDRPFSLGPVSPGSTISGSSGAATPALGRSRIELRMLQEKAIADMESAAEKGPIIPAHVYDRRNESLKSYLQLAALSSAGNMTLSMMPISLGPEIFQGRFKAVNTELKVVQKFRNPIAESVGRLKAVRGSKFNNLVASHKQVNGLRASKSAVSLPIRSVPSSVKKENSSGLSSSISPPSTTSPPEASKPSLTSSKSSMAIKPTTTRRTASRGVSFVGMDDQLVVNKASDGEISLDDIAKQLWDGILTV